MVFAPAQLQCALRHARPHAREPEAPARAIMPRVESRLRMAFTPQTSPRSSKSACARQGPHRQHEGHRRRFSASTKLDSRCSARNGNYQFSAGVRLILSTTSTGTGARSSCSFRPRPSTALNVDTPVGGRGFPSLSVSAIGEEIMSNSVLNW